MTVKFYLGCDLLGQPKVYAYSHEESAIHQICQLAWDKLEKLETFYAFIVNPCYVGSDNFEENPDLVIVSELGVGIVELKNHAGHIDCSRSRGVWYAGGGVIESGQEKNPHLQTQSYTREIRHRMIHNQERWLLGTVAVLETLHWQTAVCFTNPYADLRGCRDHIQVDYPRQKVYEPWEKFKIQTMSEICELAIEMRYEPDNEKDTNKVNFGADWYQTYHLLPAEVERIATEFFHAQPWSDMRVYVTKSREPTAYLQIVDPLIHYPPYRINREEVLIGRHPAFCDVVIPDSYKRASRKHGRLVYIAGKYYYEDLESKHASYINGKKVNGLIELSFHQLIYLGGKSASAEVCVLELMPTNQVDDRYTSTETMTH